MDINKYDFEDADILNFYIEKNCVTLYLEDAIYNEPKDQKGYLIFKNISNLNVEITENNKMILNSLKQRL